MYSSLAQCIIDTSANTSLFFSDNDKLPCLEEDVPYLFDMQVKCYKNILPGLILEWMRIDSIKNLPPGITWTMEVPPNNPSNVLNTDEIGCIQFSGTPSGRTSYYYICEIYGCMKVNLSLSPLCDNYEDLQTHLFVLMNSNPPPFYKKITFVYYTNDEYSHCITSNSNVDYKKEEVKIYPHPITNHSIISLNNYYQNIRLEVLDLNGKIIYTENVFQSDKIELSNSDLSKGIFFYNITADNVTYRGKLLIQ
jgi:hypothetical protein